MALTARLFNIIHYILSAPVDFSTANADSRPALKAMEFGSGAGDYELSKQFADTRNLAASASESLDLAGNLTNDLGAAAVFTKVKVLRIAAHPDNVNNLLVGDGATPVVGGPFGADGSQVIVIEPGGVFDWIAPKGGFTVTAGTGDLLKIANAAAGSAVNYDIHILGI